MSRPFDVRNDVWRGGVKLRDRVDPFWSGEGEWEGSGAGAAPARRQASAFALVRAIPDDPNYQRYVPVEYRLNAKAIVGDLAQDLQEGRSVHHWVEMAHGGLAVAEIAFESSILVSGLAIAGPLLGLAGTFLALGAPYQEAAATIAAQWSATGFSRGVVMGADGRPARQLINYFGNLYFPATPAFPRGRGIAMANYRVGLIAGYVQGRQLSRNQRAIFWRDLGRRMGPQSYRGPQAQWTRAQWSDWYTEIAAVFSRFHLVHSR